MSYRLRKCLFPMISDHNFNALKDNNIITVYDLISVDPEELSKKSRVTFKDIICMRKIVLAQYSAFPVSAVDILEDANNHSTVLPSCIKSVDENLLGGGLHGGDIVELVGVPASGKTQFCMYMSAVVATGSDSLSNVLYISTNGGFSADKMYQLIDKQCNDPQVLQEAIERVLCVDMHDLFDLMAFIDQFKYEMQKQTDGLMSNVRLVILDSVSSLIGPHLGGYQSEGSGYLCHLSRMLMSFARQHRIPLLLTNTMVRDKEGKLKPALGKYWAHVPNVQIQLSKDDQYQLVMKLLKSNLMAAGKDLIVGKFQDLF